MDNDLISREALCKAARPMYSKEEIESIEPIAINAIPLYNIQTAPAIDAVPAVHAEWDHWGGDEWQCTNCAAFIHTEGSWEHPWQKYCPNCGAKMDATDNNVGCKDGGTDC